MKIIDMSCRMRARAAVATEPVTTGVLAVRIAPMPPGMPGVPVTALWAWAIIETIGQDSDRIVIGGHAESMTSAAAQAHEVFENELRRRAGRK